MESQLGHATSPSIASHLSTATNWMAPTDALQRASPMGPKLSLLEEKGRSSASGIGSMMIRTRIQPYSRGSTRGKFTDHRKIRPRTMFTRMSERVESCGWWHGNAGGQVAARLEQAHPLHDEMDKVPGIARGQWRSAN